MTAKSHGSRFHLCGGLCFTRVTGEGGEDVIEIRHVPDSDPFSGEGTKLAVTSLSGWASVVAHLGHEGESAETHERALADLEGRTPGARS